jgi:transaldolase/glucose-6-phosphate isomerase
MEKMNPLVDLKQYGQSVWLDYIRRTLIINGKLEQLVRQDGLRGVSSNPTIFQKVIAGSSDYDEALKKLLQDNPRLEARNLYEKLAIEDIQKAADIFKNVYEDTDGTDGFVSLELSVGLAHDTEGSVAEARRIWKEVNRPNLMIKIPATAEGIPAVEALIGDGININITHIFSLAHYEAAAQAYIRGIKKCLHPSKVASVASFFVSHVDSAVDKALEKIGSPQATDLRGKIAIATAKIVYKRFKEIFSGHAWERLMRNGARVQRPLWASTGTKNPIYSDVLYVEGLIGPNTVNTMPPSTLNAFRDHGKVNPTLEARLTEAEASVTSLEKLGVDLKSITEKLQEDGARAFSDSFDSLLDTLEEKRHEIIHGKRVRQILELGRDQSRLEQRLKSWKKMDFARKLWNKDSSLWFSEPVTEIKDRLGWLILPEIMPEKLEDLVSFADEVKREGIIHLVLLGMGGSSLAPEVFQKTFGYKKDYAGLFVLDSTHPGAVCSMQEMIDLRKTLFLVSSKSGTTLETLSLFRHFWNEASKVYDHPGRYFVAITDPGTPLMNLAQERSFRKIFEAPPDVGGRYSALSVFGLVPAALIGLDIHKLLDKAWIALENNAFCLPEDEASGLILGAALGELSETRDKLTFLTSSSLSSFPDWIEQLIAESTGKDGKGLVPVANEPQATIHTYDKDRIFVGLNLEGDQDRELEERLKDLESAGHPTIRIILEEKADLGQEIFRWEIAVAAIGAIMGIHPFNQPDVQLAKEFTQNIMEENDPEKQKNKEVETFSIEEAEGLADALKNWILKAKPGDYIALQAYLNPLKEVTLALQKVRNELLNCTFLATTLGYGPRFLHSTGQLHKGGPNNGLFLQIVDEPEFNLPVPETSFSFGELISAQSIGDYQALKQRGRRVLRINLRRDVIRGLEQLIELIRRAKA